MYYESQKKQDAMANPGEEYHYINGGETLVPKSLNTEEAKIYMQIYKDFSQKGIAVNSFLRGIELLAKLYARSRLLEAAMQEAGGMTYAHDSGLIKEHPAARLLLSVQRQILDALKEYGQTPASMAKMKFDPRPAGKSEFDSL